jgi:heme exporter protein C
VRQSIIQWFRFASPQSFYPLAGRMIPWFWAAAAVFGIAGPVDLLLRRAHRCAAGRGLPHHLRARAGFVDVDVHLSGHGLLGRLGLAFNTRLSGMMAQALAPTGALMAFLSLWTGALWGKPMWGAWWVWDARLTSELILFFLYLGFMALQAAIDDPRRADKAGAILALVGVVNVPSSISR